MTARDRSGAAGQNAIQSGGGAGPGGPRLPGGPGGAGGRRRLPRRVFWVRRLLVAVLAMLLIAGVTRALSWAGGPEGSAGQARGQTVAGTPAPALTDLLPGPPTPAITDNPAESRSRTSPTETCVDDGVVVRPRIARAHAGSPVDITLRITTRDQACTWQLDSASVFIRINLNGETLWSSQQCRYAVPSRTLSLRPRRHVTVVVPWSGKQSDDDCTVSTPWVDPGVYRVFAVAQGSVTPEVRAFLLQKPAVRVVLVEPEPSEEPDASQKPKPTESPGPTGSTQPTRDTEGSGGTQRSEKPKPTRGTQEQDQDR